MQHATMFRLVLSCLHIHLVLCKLSFTNIQVMQIDFLQNYQRIIIFLLIQYSGSISTLKNKLKITVNA